MPNRILRDGFVDSEAVNALSDWTHRVYSNLLVKCDDAGRFDGRLEIIRSHLFPLGSARRLEDFRKSIEELSDQALVIPYEYAGKPFLQVTKWQRCGNAEQSRHPWRDGSFRIAYVKMPTRDGEKDFVTTSVSHLHPVKTPSVSHANPVGTGSGSNSIDLNTETETETETETKPPLRGSAGFERFWRAYPPGTRKVGRAKCLAKWRRERFEPRADAILEALATCKASPQWLKDGGQFIPGPHRWLSDRPWETDPEDLEPHEANGESEYRLTDEQRAVLHGDPE